ncbi:MAG: phospholipase C, phosphocholine-specific [Bacteroidetes bacterium]|nr:phospholipase C, phosphocholine-specific [Bacteroidota bacterium]
MGNRREFIKKAAILAGGTGLNGAFPQSIQRALAINPAAGSTWLDAEHVVILMQENRSFDHCYGMLQGVRGYRDPRAIALPGGNPVWLQTNAEGEVYAPFRLDIKDTKATWMGSLPHSWTDQADARNEGKYDQWLVAKRSGNKDFAAMPLTMGYYDRRDLPFYYSLADAFTIADQNFCSSLTGTTPNRLHLWTGTIRGEASARARVRNEDTDYGVEASWVTFPERLEDAGVSWRVYQNELSVYQGFRDEEEAWLSNFTDNPLEWFTQYQVRFSPAYMDHLPEIVAVLKKEVAGLEAKLGMAPSDEAVKRRLEERQAVLKIVEKDMVELTPERRESLSQRTKDLHAKAFTRNSGDRDFHSLDSMGYMDGDRVREMKAPKGDVLWQFRKDAGSGSLPTVSWLVAPENFSDHPGAPWYGAWYVSEVLDILTKNPEVWKKTILILCYDENDGYFDHVSPFVAPDPARPETGLVGAGIDAKPEYHSRQDDLKRVSEKDARGGPIGLGYRVPLVVASPWSRGGYVNSQVFDHTSILMMLEKLVRHRTGKDVRETNISGWRRAVCGDLSTMFRPYNGEKIVLPEPLGLAETLKGINKAQYLGLPMGYKKLSEEEIAEARREGHNWKGLPDQERGTRRSCALPYLLGAWVRVTDGSCELGMEVRGTAAAPFTAYMGGSIRNYAVTFGVLTDRYVLEGGKYDLRVYGPNGWYWEMKGDGGEPDHGMRLWIEDSKLIIGVGSAGAGRILTITDNTYGEGTMRRKLDRPDKGGGFGVRLPLRKHRWFDYTVRVEGADGFLRRFAGRVENGQEGVTDPAMG